MAPFGHHVPVGYRNRVSGGEFRTKSFPVVAVAVLVGTVLSGCGRAMPPAAQPVAAAQSVPASATPDTEAAGLPRADTGATGRLDTAHNPDWMSALPDDLPISALSVPGTHDTMSIHGGKAGPAVVTQETFDSGCADPGCASIRTLGTQLEAGVRALDIRVRRDEAGELTVQHGGFSQHVDLDRVLEATEQFLSRHPRELVLMRLKAECTNDGKPFQCSDAESRPPDSALIDRYLNAHRSVWRPAAIGRAAIPRIADVRGQLVVLCADGIDQRGLPLDVQDMWNGPSREDKWAAVATHLGSIAAHGGTVLSMDYLSASGVPDPSKFPDRYATFENQRALDYLRGRPDISAGVVMMDFPGPALVGEIIAHNRR